MMSFSDLSKAAAPAFHANFTQKSEQILVLPSFKLVEKKPR